MTRSVAGAMQQMRQLMLLRNKLLPYTVEAVLPAANGRLLHYASPTQAGMHGPGGQPSGAPALNKSMQDQPSRDDAPSKGSNNVVSDSPPSQGTDATSGTSTSPAKGGAKPAPGETTRRTFSTFSKCHNSHMFCQVTPHAQQPKPRSFHANPCSMAVGPARSENHDTSRDTAAQAEAINVDQGVASGSTRGSPKSTGKPGEAAPTASEVVPPNVDKKGLQGTVKEAQGNLQDTKNKQVSRDT